MAESLTFNNPQEELAYLRSIVVEKEKQLEQSGASINRPNVIRESIKAFGEQSPSSNTHIEAQKDVDAILEKHKEVELEEVMSITEKKGIAHSLALVEKLKGWRLEDDFHDYLVSLVSQGLPIPGLKEKGPVYKALHMTLFEIVLPKGTNDKAEKPLAELIKSMEQLYAGLLSVSSNEKNETNYLVFEIANPDGAEDTQAFVSVPSDKKELFKRQMLSIFPNAKLIEREHDYNIFNELGVARGSSAKLASSPAYPLKTFDTFSEDPMNVILNGFSKIPKTGAGASMQIIFKPAGTTYTDKYKDALTEIQKGKKPKEVLAELNIGKEVAKTFASMLFGEKKPKEDKPQVDQGVVDAINKKLESQIVETNIRLAVSSETEKDAEHLLHNLESAFNQFENSGKQSFSWQRTKISKESDFYRAFTFRLYREAELMPLNTKELSTILHFHTQALSTDSSLKQSGFKSAPAPSSIKNDGVLIGINDYQGKRSEVHLSPEDRLRHFYTIGQTGTGKSTLLKNMIIEDIHAGNGVCMIDPHGSDVLDVLANIPPERRDDVIYFDPASIERPMALNMLEYDPQYPEQKTFVVNELFSIFQKLYGGVPESMGPMFEQYFRNATMLVIEDPDTGSTLLDVSRVMTNKAYRELKLSRCKNPIVVQFWKEIAEKAGGEGALANVVPYITSKFDIFLANDIMRPIIAQERSSFNFREIMDSKKILLVNLSKGRLGDINANLIGLILVGKILMAALSRVNTLGVGDMPPFYLFIDEFQNITTNSIATILSEARKYKLSLVLAHQFIDQIEDDIKSAVFGNVGSICAFRVGRDDAEYLEKQFAPTFSANDLSSIDNFHAYVKMLVDGRPREPFDIQIMPRKIGDPAQLDSLKELSSLRYGRNRVEVEAQILAKYKKEETPF